MSDRFQYRLSNKQKSEIAQNLIDILQNDAPINKPTVSFISNWLLTGHDEKRKAFYDVWDIVLKDYLPTTRPVLFRSCKRISKKDRIASFTGRLECARKFSNGRGFLIVCDTQEHLRFEEELYKIGEYRHTFYPLVNVLTRAKNLGGCGFNERTLVDFIGEDEYIMRVDKGNMCSLRWAKNL